METKQMQINIVETPKLGDTVTINGIKLTYNEKGILVSYSWELTCAETFTNARNNIETV